MVIMASSIARCHVHTMAAINDGVMQDGNHTPAFDIGHPCYGQLTSVRVGYLLTSVTGPYCGLKFGAHQGHMFF